VSKPAVRVPANASPCHAARLATDSQVAALSIEFVAKPQEAQKAHCALPAAVVSALHEVTGFAGCFVLVSNLEARLVTVVTLWTGSERVQRCRENTRWIRAILKPYLDHCLRVQTLAAFIPTAPEIHPASGNTASHAVHETVGLEDEVLQVV